MRVICERSDRTYGSPRLYRALVGLGYAVSHRRVERLMRQAQWRARVVRVYRRTTGTHRWFAQHPNRVRAQMTTAPDQIWVGDLTYVPVASQWYVAAILDRHSRRHSPGGRTRRSVTGGLAPALRRRQPPAD